MAKRGRRGRDRKKTRTHQGSAGGVSAASSDQPGGGSALVENQELKVPKSLVIRKGRTANEVSELVHDLRHLMMPYTALHFKEDAKNRKLTLQQYSQSLALPMGISHIMAFSQNEERLNLRVARTPEGPTLHFRVHQFSLAKHIKGLQRRPVSNTAALQSSPPLVVTNNFGATGSSSSGGSKPSTDVAPHVKLMRITFQNMFPAINVATVNLSECRRVVLFHLLTEEETAGEGLEEEEDSQGDNDEEKNQPRKRQVVQMRHYAIKTTPVGLNRNVRRLVKNGSRSGKRLPNLHKVNDIADYVTGTAQAAASSSSGASVDGASDSEAEDDNSANAQTVMLPLEEHHQRGSKHHTGGSVLQKSALKLVEIGPRLSMELIKVEKGGLGSSAGGETVLYHAHVKKTPEEVAQLKERKQQEAALKSQRRASQEANVERKRKAVEEKREAKRQRQEDRKNAAMEALRAGRRVDDQNPSEDDDESDPEDQTT